MIDESNFIDKLKKKNPKALEFVIDMYSNLVYKVAYSILGHEFEKESLEECTSDVFIGVWNNIDMFHSDKGNFKSWLIAVTRYKAIDYKRKLSKEDNLQYSDDLNAENRYNTEKVIIFEENKKEILHAIGKLSDVDRKIFIKKYLLGVSIQSIAKELGVNRSVIDNRLSRGRKVLREKLSFLKEENI